MSFFRPPPNGPAVADQVPSIRQSNLLPVETETRVAGPALLDVEQLVKQFRSAHADVGAGVRMSIAAQVRCGLILKQLHGRIKKQVGAGYWGAWVEANCGVSLRQVQRYIQKTTEFGKLSEGLGSEATAMSLLAQRDTHTLNRDRGRRKKPKPQDKS